MAVRNIVEIDEEKCDGCGLCVISCAEGALEVREGKAKIIKEIYNEFPNDVKNHMTFSYPEIYKHNYHPRIDI